MTPVYGQDDLVAQFVASFFPGGERGFGPCTAIGFADATGAIVAGTVFHNWSPDARVCEMTSASVTPAWLTRRTLRAIFGFLFEQIDCQMVVMRVSERNRRMCSIAERFGFTGHRIERLRGPDEAEMLFTLTVEDWRTNKLMGS